MSKRNRPKKRPAVRSRKGGSLRQIETFRLYVRAKGEGLKKVEGDLWFQEHFRGVEMTEIHRDPKATDVVVAVDIDELASPNASRFFRTHHDNSPLVSRAESAFRWLDVFFLDKTVVDEQVGDAMEVINKIVHVGKFRRRSLAVWLKIITTYVWVVVNSIRSKFREHVGKRTKG